MDRHLGFYLKKLSNKFRRKIDNTPSVKSLNDCNGISFGILTYIDKKGSINQKELENEFGITRSTASKVVSLLEKKELIIRENDPDDARSKILTITPKAKEFCKFTKCEIIELENELLSIYSNDELEVLFSLLDRLDKKLDE